MVNCSRKTKNQPWFTANLAELRKTMHKSEVRLLKCTAADDIYQCWSSSRLYSISIVVFSIHQLVDEDRL